MTERTQYALGLNRRTSARWGKNQELEGKSSIEKRTALKADGFEWEGVRQAVVQKCLKEDATYRI